MNMSKVNHTVALVIMEGHENVQTNRMLRYRTAHLLSRRSMAHETALWEYSCVWHRRMVLTLDPVVEP